MKVSDSIPHNAPVAQVDVDQITLTVISSQHVLRHIKIIVLDNFHLQHIKIHWKEHDGVNLLKTLLSHNHTKMSTTSRLNLTILENLSSFSFYQDNLLFLLFWCLCFWVFGCFFFRVGGGGGGLSGLCCFGVFFVGGGGGWCVSIWHLSLYALVSENQLIKKLFHLSSFSFLFFRIFFCIMFLI